GAPVGDTSGRAAADSATRRVEPRLPSAPVGARVARVAVDDATWAAFRKLCGATPASVRLAQLVEADVRRATAATPESEALTAIESIRNHTAELEAFVRDSGTRG